MQEDGSLNSALADRVMPYGSGHRRCGGESLARLEVYLFVATDVDRCQVVGAASCPLVLVNGDMFTVGRGPKPVESIMKSRFGGW